MPLESVSFHTVFQEIAQQRASAVDRRGQPVRDGRGPHVAAAANVPASLSPQEREERELGERRPVSVPARAAGEDPGSPPSWAFDGWPFPFTSFWTGLVAVALCRWADSLLLTLPALVVGLWAGVVLNRWLCRHPSAAPPWMRFLLGVSRP